MRAEVRESNTGRHLEKHSAYSMKGPDLHSVPTADSMNLSLESKAILFETFQKELLAWGPKLSLKESQTQIRC